MKIRSIKTNYILNLLRILSSTIIGVFTMPYINKVLGPDSVGKVEYVNSIITYFILFSALGIPVYGIREVAKVKNDNFILSKTVIELLIILFLTTVISYIILSGILLNTGIFISYRELVIIMSSMILLNNIGAEWFFQGIEDQLYITIRFIIVRLLTIILLFTTVKGSDDYIYYSIIVVLNFCGSNILNLFRLRKYLDIKDIKFKDLNFLRHIRPSLTIFIASISVSIYLQIDNFLLGYLAGDKYVGFYSAANKLLRYIILFIVSIGSVLLPRLSNLWDTDKTSYHNYLTKSLSYMVLISIPCSIGVYFFANSIIHYMAGDKFQEAILTLKILSPICFLVALAYFFGYLVLYSQGREKLYTISVTISALISIGLNYFLIKEFYQNGAALTQVISEFLGVLIILLFVIKKNSMRNMFNLNLFRILASNVLLIIFLIILFYFFDRAISHNLFYFISAICCTVIFYFVSLFILKEDVILNVLSELRSKYLKNTKY